MEKNINYKCKLFYCPHRKSYTCCRCCERRDECEGRCKNVPEKCGYSSARIQSEDVICPFFGWTSYRNINEKKRITCEGLINGTNDITEFKSDTEKTNHMRQFCCENYVSCAKAKELLRLYDSGEKSDAAELT